MAFRRLPPWALIPLAGGAWWVAGYLFWLLEGLRDRGIPGTAGTVDLAVPLVTSRLGLLLVGALTGGVVAGLLCLVARPGRRWPAVLATFGGVALAVMAALVVTGGRLTSAAPVGFDGEYVVVLGLSVLVVATAVFGWAIGSAALLGRPCAGLALAVVAGVLPSWLSAVGYAVLDPVTYSLMTAIGYVSPWLGAAVLAAALVVVGPRPPSRLLWWPLLVAVAWFLGSFLTAVSYLEPLLHSGAGLPASLGDSLAAAGQVFVFASNPAGRYVEPWIGAVGIAVVACVVLSRRPVPGSAG